MPTKATLLLPLLSWTGERKYNKRLMGQDKDGERPLSNHHHVRNRLDLGKLVEFISNQNQSKIMRK